MKSSLTVKAKLFVLCFLIENNNNNNNNNNKKIYIYIQKKDCPSIFITHQAIFDVENCLFGIRTKKKV